MTDSGTATEGHPAIIEPPTTSLEVPIDHYGETVTARLVVRGDELTRDAFLEGMKVLAASKAPFTVSFENAASPPPFYVTLTEVKRVLGITDKWVQNFINWGWLRVVHHRPDDSRDISRVTSPETAEKTGDYTGWVKRVVWADVVALHEWSLNKGHLPTPKSMGPRPGIRRRNSPSGHTRIDSSRVARKVLQDARDENGRQAWLTLAEITERATEIAGREVSYKTVQSTISTGRYSLLKKGVVKRRVTQAHVRRNKAGEEFVAYGVRKLLNTSHQFQWVGVQAPKPDDEETAE